MFIAFEGIRRSGKSTLSLALLEYLNNEFKDSENYVKADPHFGDFQWTKEPTFPKEEADDLNIRSDVDEYRRERTFFESRIDHQNGITGKNIICEQYIWCALAHTFVFSPGCFKFAKELYLSEYLFVQPDLYIQVSTNPEVCYERDTSMSLDLLKRIEQSYRATQEFINVPVLKISSIGGEDRAIGQLKEMFDNYMKEIKVDNKW